MDMIAAFNDVGSYRGAAAICGVDHKTVKRALARSSGPPEARPHNYDLVADVVARRVSGTSARISAKRLLPEAWAVGYTGSARNFRRLVAKTKGAWRSGHRRGRRPGVRAWRGACHRLGRRGRPAHLLRCDGFFARRFVRFAADEKATTTFEMLARCFEALGGAPKVVLADRMGCLKGGSWPTWWCRRRPTCALPVPMVSGRTFARATTQNRRGSSKTWSATPNPTWWSPGAWPRATS